MKLQKIYTSQFTDLFTYLIEADLVQEHIMHEGIGSMSVYFHSADSETELAIKVLGDRLILSRLLIYHRYNGIGTKIINWLENFAITNGYTTLVLESIITQEMVNLAAKLNYSPTAYSTYELNAILYGNYIKNLND